MTSSEQPDARTEGAEPPHLPVRATAFQVTPLFDTSCAGLTTGEQDRQIKGQAAQVSREPGAMVATRWSNVGRYQRERRSGTRSAAPRRHVCVSRGPVSTGPACRSAVSRRAGTSAVLAGRTRNEAEPKHVPHDEETRGIVTESPARSTSDTGSTVGRADSVASQDVPSAIRGTGWKPAMRSRLATSRGPPVTMRAGTLRHGADVSRGHVDRVPRHL